jgi:gliding motility-associated-like protein
LKLNLSLSKIAISFLLFLSCHDLFAQSLNDSLIAHYPFDGNALDISGNDNHGTLFGPTLVPDRFGNNNSAYLFNGTSDYIHYISNSKFKPPSFPISVSMWLKSNDNSSIGTVFKNDVVIDIYTGIWLQIHSSTGKVEISYGDGGTTDGAYRKTKLGTTNVNDNQWHFVAAVIRSASDMDIWIDCQYDVGVYSGSGGNLAYSNNGGSSGYYDVVAGTEYYGGVIDDIRFYNRELTQTDLSSLSIFPQPFFNTYIQNFSLGNDTSLCGTNTINLNANVSFPNITYNWSTGSTQNAITIFTPGIYWLEISDGCVTKRDSISIENNNLTITASNDTAICSGNTINLNVSGNATNYVWTINGSTLTGNSISVSPTSTTIYFVQGIDSLCSSPVESITVSVQSGSSSPNFNTPAIICENTNFEFINNSTLGASYQWNYGDPLSGSSNTSTDYNGNHTFSQPGTYLVTLIVQGTCFIDSTTQAVTVLAVPITVASNDVTICEGQSALMVATGGNLFFWDNDIGSTSDSIYVFPNVSTIYQVQAIANGCYGDPDTIYINVNPNPSVQILASQITCSGAPVELIASGNATSYNWTGGYNSTNDTIAFIPQINTDYILIGLLNNCSAADTFRIIEFQNSKAIFDYQIDSCSAKLKCINKSTGANQYLWNFDNQTSILAEPIFEINDFKNEESLQLILNPNTPCADTSLLFLDLMALANDLLFIPNIFTPNNDNLNDVFVVKSKFDCEPIMIFLYNRWGELVFQQESTNIEWNGKYKSKDVAQGVYFYMIEHRNKKTKGTVTLFR